MTERTDRTYNVNMKRLALLALPTWLRRPLAGALIYAGVKPLGRMLNELRTLRRETRYRLEHNGQVCRLRGALNDLLDPRARRIRVEDAEDVGLGETVRLRREGAWLMARMRSSGAGLRVYRRGYGGLGGVDFRMVVPAELRGDEDRMRGILSIYKLASKRYAIDYEE